MNFTKNYKNILVAGLLAFFVVAGNAQAQFGYGDVDFGYTDFGSDFGYGDVDFGYTDFGSDFGYGDVDFGYTDFGSDFGYGDVDFGYTDFGSDFGYGDVDFGYTDFGSDFGYGDVDFGYTDFGSDFGYGDVDFDFGSNFAYGDVDFGSDFGYGDVDFGSDFGYGDVDFDFGSNFAYGDVDFGSDFGYGDVDFGSDFGYGDVDFDFGSNFAYGDVDFGPFCDDSYDCIPYCGNSFDCIPQGGSYYDEPIDFGGGFDGFIGGDYFGYIPQFPSFGGGYGGGYIPPVYIPEPPVITPRTPRFNDLQVTCEAIVRGNEVRWIARAYGGDGRYDYDWSGDVRGDERIEAETYRREGTYRATIKVESRDGQTDRANCSARVQDTPRVPVDHDVRAVCVVSKDSVRVGEQVSFTANVSGGNGNVSYFWSGAFQGNARVETVIFNQPGTYTVALGARDADGDFDNDVCTVVVTGSTSTAFSLTSTPGIGNPPTGQQAANVSSVLLSQVPYTGPADAIPYILWSIVAILASIAGVRKYNQVTYRKSVANRVEAFKEANKASR